MTIKVRYTQPLLATGATGYLVAVPDVDSVLIRQDGVECDVFADNAGTALDNPVPVGVAPNLAGVDTAGTLTIYLEPGNGYDGQATVGAVVSTFLIPDISPDVADTGAAVDLSALTASVVAVAVDVDDHVATPHGHPDLATHLGLGLDAAD